MKTKEITSRVEIELMVNSFYDRIRKDELLAPIFEKIIQDNWPIHLEKMNRFWESLLLGKNTYTGSPFAPHARMPLNEEHFNRWLTLFNSTVDDLFHGDNAEEAKNRASKIAYMFQYKIEYLKR